MDENKIELRKSRRRLMISAIISGLLGAGLIINAFMFWNSSEGQWMVILGGVVSLCACIYFIKEWRDHKVEIVITEKGIRLRSKGFYDWSSIENFTIDMDEGDETLILRIRNQAGVHFGITSLEVKSKELITLMLAHGKSSNLTYTKH